MLAPTRSMLRDGYSEEEYLSLLESRADDIKEEMECLKKEAGGREIVVCCFESLKDPDQYCHRRTFADWWELETGEKVKEL